MTNRWMTTCTTFRQRSAFTKCMRPQHTLTWLDKPYVEDANVVLNYQGLIDQPLDDEMHHVPPVKRVD